METPSPTYIHLGLPKTATTCLQSHLFGKHSQIHYFGKFVPGGFPPVIHPCLLSTYPAVKRFDPGDIRMASIKEQLTFAANKGLIPVLSKEGLAAGSPDRKRKQAQRFMEAFGDCKAILVVREPVSFIRSYYVQMIKQFNAGPPGRRPDWMRTLGKPPHYFDINEWMAAAWPSRTSPKKALAYADTAGIYADVFGRENIHVFIFEELVRNPEQFVSRLCTCLGIDGKEGFDLINGKRSNKRMSTGAIDRIKRIEKSFIQTLRFRCTGGEQRRRMLFPPDDSGEKIKPEISDKWLAEIHALGTEQNRRLAEEWGLPLADYGYRL